MPRLRYTTDGVQQATAAQKRINEGIEKQAESVEKVTRSQAELGRVAKAAARANEDAQARLLRLLDEVKDAYDAGKLSTEEYKKSVTNLNAEFESGEGRFNKFSEKSKEAFGSNVISRIGQFAAGMFSIAEAQKLITDELEAQQRITDARGQAAVTIASAENDLARNLIGASPAEFQSALAGARGLASELRIPDEFAIAGLAKAIGPANLDVNRALALLAPALSLLRDVPADAPQFAQTIGSIGQLSGTDDAVTNLGIALRTAGRSSITEPGNVARNVGPGLLRIVEAGQGQVSIQEASNLFVGISNAMDERIGEMTSSVGQALTERILAFDFGVGAAATAQVESDRRGFRFGGDLTRQIVASKQVETRLAERRALAASAEGLDINERIALIRSEGLGAEFGPERIPQRGQPFVKGLLSDPDSALSQSLAAANANADTLADIRGVAVRTLGNISSTPAGARAARQSSLAAGAQRQLLIDDPGKLTVQELDDISIRRQLAGESVAGIKLSRLDARLRAGSTQLSLEDEIRQVRTARDLSRARGLGGEEARSQELLDALIRELKEQTKVQEQTRDAIQGLGLRGESK